MLYAVILYLLICTEMFQEKFILIKKIRNKIQNL